MWSSAIKSASIGDGISIQNTIITLLPIIKDVISTFWQHASGSASVRSEVRIEHSVVTEFVWFKQAVSAFFTAKRCASVSILVVTVITFLIKKCVNNSVSTEREDTVGSASVGQIGIQQSLIANLLGIDDSVSAIRKAAICSTAIGDAVTVLSTSVTFFLGNCSVRPG